MTMKTNRIFMTAVLIPMLYCCEKQKNNINIDSLLDTKWTLSQIINNKTEEIEKFPEQLDNFDIIFQSNGNLQLLGFCNFSYGEFELINFDSLRIKNIGPSTLKYCHPDLSMDWELIFATNFPDSKTYSIYENQLSINTANEYNLVFEFVKKLDRDLKLIGKWKAIEKENILLDTIIQYPKKLDSNLLIEFNNDSIYIIGCELILGGSGYYTDENKISINPLSIIEICALNGWIEFSTKLLSSENEYILKNDTLKLISRELQESLVFQKVKI